MKNSKAFKIIIIVLVLLIAAGAVLFVYKDKIFNSKKSDKKDAKKTEKSADVDVYEVDFDDDYNKYVDLATYKGVELDKDDIEDEYNSTIESTIKNYITADDYDKITDRAVKDGDVVNIYYVGKVDGKKFDGGSLTKKDNKDGYNLTIGSNSFIDDFEDQLIGSKPGDTVEVEVTFPDDYKTTDLAGKDAVFTVDVNYIQGDLNMPEITDKFVKKNFSGTYKDAKDMKDTIRKSTINSLAWNVVCDQSEVKDYPEGMVKGMYNQLYLTSTSYLEAQGYTLEDFLKSQGSTEDDFEKELQSTAEDYVDRQIITMAIAQNEDIEVDEDKYKEQIDSYISSYSSTDESIKDEDSLNTYFKKNFASTASDIIKEDLLTTAVREFIAENVVEK